MGGLSKICLFASVEIQRVVGVGALHGRGVFLWHIRLRWAFVTRKCTCKRWRWWDVFIQSSVLYFRCDKLGGSINTSARIVYKFCSILDDLFPVFPCA